MVANYDHEKSKLNLLTIQEVGPPILSIANRWIDGATIVWRFSSRPTKLYFNRKCKEIESGVTH